MITGRINRIGISFAVAAITFVNSSQRVDAEERTKLIVVAPADFEPALKSYVDYKQSIRATDLIALETVLSETEGVDDPEKLKRYLYARWKSEPIGYVLLVGDASIMPVRYMVLDRVTAPAFDYAFYPSDLYYSDLAKDDESFEDWNGAKEGFHKNYFGEVRGEKNKSDPINFDQIDYLPDVAIGRWPVETIEEVERIAKKTTEYEKRTRATQDGEKSKVAFLSVGGWVDSRGLFDTAATKLEHKWRVDRSYYSDKQRKSENPPSHAVTKKFFNDGVQLVVHAGHGQPNEWEQCFSVRDLEQISNFKKLPVVVSAGCSTAYFATLPPYEPYADTDGDEHRGTNFGDVFQGPPPPPSPYQRGAYNTTGLGEQLLRRDVNGSVAYIGCNTGSQPCGLTLVEGFLDSLAVRQSPTLGDCWSDAIRHYHQAQNLAGLKPNNDWYPPSIFFQGMKFMVFGDPSIPMPSNR